jgi:hypothetical protein
MEEMFALHASEHESIKPGKGVGSYSFMLKQVTEEEWQALRTAANRRTAALQPLVSGPKSSHIPRD